MQPTEMAPGTRQLSDDGLSLGEIYATVMESRWVLVRFIAVALLLGLVWLMAVRPNYRADGLVEVEENGSSALSSLKDLSALMGLQDTTTVAAQQEILNSRYVLARVIEKQRLMIEAEPRYFPLLGRYIASRHEVAKGLRDPLLGLDGFAWGGERIDVQQLEVPAHRLNERLNLYVIDRDRFSLEDGGEIILSGRVGEKVSSGSYTIFVSALIARPGARFDLVRLSADEAQVRLVKNYSVKEKGKKSGILEVSLQGPEQEKIRRVLEDILNVYVRQNVDRHSAEAENSLRFLETQLPIVKKDLEQAENEYNRYRQNRGSLDLTVETQSVLNSIVDIDNQIVALKQERDELRQYFTGEHPRIQAVDAKLEKLRGRRSDFDSQIARLPETQQTVLRLSRDVEVNTTLYTNLLNTTQQLRVSKAGAVGNVRIIDAASVTTLPVGLKPVAIVGIAVLIGFVFGLGYIWLRSSMRVVVEDPEDIEQRIGLPVYASIPFSAQEKQIAERAGKGCSELLAVTHPEDDAIESLRSLRTTLHFALLDSGKSSLLVTGPSPGLGKSFISKNLAAVLAQSGKRVVIVDSDLRRGHINKEFGLKREGGASEYVAGSVSLEDVLKPTNVPNLSVVTTGQIPPNPSDILMHPKFEELLERLGEKFDTVIVDAPPVLAVSDAAIIARYVGATLLVARAGRHPIQELEQTVKRLVQAGIQVKGFVFNGLDLNRQRYRYGYKGYVYRYSYQSTKS